MSQSGLTYNPDTGSYDTSFWSPEQWSNFGAAGGTVEGGKLMLGGNQINVPTNNSIFGTEGFGFNKSTMQGLGSIGQIGAGLGSLFLGAKQLGLAEDKFKFDKDMLNKQYAMAKENYDRQKARSESIGSQMQSGRVG